MIILLFWEFFHTIHLKNNFQGIFIKNIGFIDINTGNGGCPFIRRSIRAKNMHTRRGTIFHPERSAKKCLRNSRRFFNSIPRELLRHLFNTCIARKQSTGRMPLQTRLLDMRPRNKRMGHLQTNRVNHSNRWYQNTRDI